MFDSFYGLYDDCVKSTSLVNIWDGKQRRTIFIEINGNGFPNFVCGSLYGVDGGSGRMALSNKRVGKMLWEYILRHFFGILMDFDLKQHEKLHPERGENAKEKESQWSETPSCKEE